MWRWFARKARERRAKNYLLIYPDDEAAVRTILATFELFRPMSARQIAEITAGRSLSNDEWDQFGARWERAWAAINSK